MSTLLVSALCLTMVGTSFLSGIFGMAGGMILIGVCCWRCCRCRRR